MRTRRWIGWAVLLCVPLGCTTKAEREFVIADCEVVGLYIQRAQPAVAAYCDALAAGGQPDKAAELRADTQMMAAEMQANAALRIDKLRVDAQLVSGAQTALDVAKAVLDALDKAQGAGALPTSSTGLGGQAGGEEVGGDAEADAGTD